MTANGLRDNEVLIEDSLGRKCTIPIDQQSVAVMGLHGKQLAKIGTNGNGKCGMHSVFGTPSPLNRELQDPRALNRILQLLPASLPVLRGQLDERGNFYLDIVLGQLVGFLREAFL